MACTLPSCFLAGDVGGGERKVGGFCFPKTRVEWRVEWSGGEEKRRECDVWPRVEWSGGEEKKGVWSGLSRIGRAEFSDPAHAFLVGRAGRPVGPGPF